MLYIYTPLSPHYINPFSENLMKFHLSPQFWWFSYIKSSVFRGYPIKSPHVGDGRHMWPSDPQPAMTRTTCAQPPGGYGWYGCLEIGYTQLQFWWGKLWFFSWSGVSNFQTNPYVGQQDSARSCNLKMSVKGWTRYPFTAGGEYPSQPWCTLRRITEDRSESDKFFFRTWFDTMFG